MTATRKQQALVIAWYAIAGVVGAAVAATVLAVWPAGATDAVPYNDGQSIGAITLYDKAGNTMSGGKVTDRPFVWRAASSQKAPAPYDKEGRKATLLAYQPRKGASPAEWSGDTMTASTGYTDVNHPTVQATDTDFTLKDFLDGFPAGWDGLVQLRIYFGAPEQPTLTSKYVTADIRVTGDSWALVRSGPAAGQNGSGSAPSANGGLDNADAGSGSAGGGSVSGADTVNASSSGAILPDVSTPRILIVAAAAVVGVVALGLIRRRRPEAAGPPSRPREKQPA